MLLGPIHWPLKLFPERIHKQRPMTQQKAHARLLILAAVALFWMTAVSGRLAYLQLFRHSDYVARAARQQRRVIEITPKRGGIYDRNLHPLAMSVPVQSAFAVPGEVKDVPMAARLISGALGIPPEGEVHDRTGRPYRASEGRPVTALF